MPVNSSFTPATPLIYTATVIEVDPEAYTMRFFSKQKGITMPVEIPSMFTNSRGGNGGGIHVMPEVGAEVWVCETSDGMTVPLQYHGVIGDGKYTNDRPVGLPGDIVFSTTHGNSIKVLKGGSILTEASPVCSTTHDPMSDSIRHFASSFYRYSLSSKEEHMVDYEANRDCESEYSYYYNADDEQESVKVSIGSDNSAVYKLEVNNRDSAFATAFTADLFANGDGVVVGSDLHIDVELCTVGAKTAADFVVNSTQFLSDLNAVLGELQKLLPALETPLATFAATQGVTPGTPAYDAIVPSVASITSMITNIASGIYPTNKLKSE